MLGGGSSQGNGAFSCSSSSALPPARRHHHHHHHHQQQTATAACWNANNPFHNGLSGSVVVPSTASEEAQGRAAVPHSYQGQSIQPRKRPGCLCDHYDDDDDDEEEEEDVDEEVDGSFIRLLAANNSSISNNSHCHSVVGVRNCYPLADQSVQPLDLSLPKVKVRQHWSGGSIVQVNDSTIISIGGECCSCPSSSAAAAVVAAGASSSTTFSGSSPPGSSRLNVSVVTVPQQPCWPSSNFNNSLTVDRLQQQQQQQQPFRLQIEIPFVADKLSGFFRQPNRQQQQQPTGVNQQQPQQHRRKSSHCAGNNNNSTTTTTTATTSSSSSSSSSSSLRPAEVHAAAVMTDEEDDLQRLSDSAHQLRLSGYYYGHLSWKESMQLLHNTKVGTFLVRDSSDARYLYALSLQTDKGPTSVRIHYSSKGFRLDASNTGMADHLPRFRTVLDLIDHYVAKWSQCRDKGQFWLDNSGQVHSEVVLIRPLMRDCPSLKHLCRLTCNRRRHHQSSANNSSSTSSVKIPSTIQSYLNEYPYQH